MSDNAFAHTLPTVTVVRAAAVANVFCQGKPAESQRAQVARTRFRRKFPVEAREVPPHDDQRLSSPPPRPTARLSPVLPWRTGRSPNPISASLRRPTGPRVVSLAGRIELAGRDPARAIFRRL